MSLNRDCTVHVYIYYVPNTFNRWNEGGCKKMSWNIGLFLFDGLWVKAPGSTLGTQHVWLVIFQLNLIEPKKCILLRKFHQINCALKNWWKKFYESFPSCELFPSLCMSKILNENVHCRPSMMSQKIPRCLTASEGLFQASLNWKEPSKTGLIKVNQKIVFFGSEIWKPEKWNIWSGWKLEIEKSGFKPEIQCIFQCQF